MQVNNTYVGRFAPSPTGPLHFGSLIAALASYLDARHNNGVWLLRIEDLDPPRESLSAPAEIINQLKSLQFEWDGDPIYQSQRLSTYEAALAHLRSAQRLFACSCSRKSFDRVYPGTCRGSHDSDEPHALRIQVEDSLIEFSDSIQGEQHFNLTHDGGDFILKRKDGLFAYQLAVVVDDHAEGITHVIRGSDLLDSTPRQIFVAECLGYKSPTFGHFPVVTDPTGQKLSKQAHARTISGEEPRDILKRALEVLGQKVPGGASSASCEAIMTSAIADWSIDRIPKQMSLLSPLL